MISLLLPILLTPVAGFVGCALVPKKQERTIFFIAMAAMFAEFVWLLVLCYQLFSTGSAPISTHVGNLYASARYTMSLDCYVDWLALSFSGIATAITALVFIFSRYYMHRDSGFKRFYVTVFLFFIGLLLIILAGNFEVLFLGWEFIGMSSVLLIAYYRNRFLPTRNALLVFSLYRIADACLLAAIWYAHHAFGGQVHFDALSGIVAQHKSQAAIFSILLLVAAAVKSAQFPFSYWLPRAMEGPTVSSAVMYGALSVHMGLYLLLRTYPLWEGSLGIRIAIAVVGLITALIASSITRVQSSIKTQIAYASVTQIGIMFVELAAGLRWLVVLHFVSNASLRAYQLLISPSAVSYLVHNQFFYFVPPVQRIRNTLLGKLRATSYVLGIKEWNMRVAVSKYVWKPLKSIGKAFAFLDAPSAQIFSLVLLLAATTITVYTNMAASLTLATTTAAAIVSIIFYVRAYTTKGSARMCWNLIMLGHLFGAFFLMLAAHGSTQDLMLYGTGVAAAFVVGHLCLRYLKVVKGEPDTLQDYHGSMYVSRKVSYLFFIVCLLFMAFPISPTFLAQDIFLGSIPESHMFQILLFCLSYLLTGISIMRLYVKTFFGPHKMSYHYKSS